MGESRRPAGAPSPSDHQKPKRPRAEGAADEPVQMTLSIGRKSVKVLVRGSPEGGSPVADAAPQASWSEAGARSSGGASTAERPAALQPVELTVSMAHGTVKVDVAELLQEAMKKELAIRHAAHEAAKAELIRQLITKT